MYIPSIALETVKKNPLNNCYFNHAEKSWDRLAKVRNGSIEYIWDDFSSLIGTLERFYKGLIQSKLDSIEAYKVPDKYLRGHCLQKYVNEIENNFTPLFAGKTNRERHQINRFLYDLETLYATSRYEEYPTFEDFKNLYTFVEIQRTAIYDYLLPKQQESVYEEDYDENYDDYPNFTTN